MADASAECPQFQKETHGEIMVISIVGPRLIDDKSIFSLERSLIPVLRQGRRLIVVLELSKLEYLSSEGAGLIMRSKQTVADNGGAVVVCGLRPSVFELFSLMRIDRLVRFFGSLSDVEAAVAAGESLEPELQRRTRPTPAEVPVQSSAMLKRPSSSSASAVHYVNDPALKQLIRIWNQLSQGTRERIIQLAEVNESG